MFYINKETNLDSKMLYKMINAFITNELPKLETRKKYYDGEQAISNKTYADTSKTSAKATTNYCKNIANSYCGYIASPSYISYRSKEDITEIMEVLKYNDYQTEDADFLLDALIYGRACELMYLDNEAKIRFRLINPTQCFGIYDNSLSGDLLYFVRFYKEDEWANNDNYLIDLYSNEDIKHYRSRGLGGALEFIEEEVHFFNQCPSNIFTLSNEESIFDCITSLQDAYNELLSDEIDDYASFCDAYLSLYGVDAEAEDIAQMKKNRVMLLPNDAKAEYLTKNLSDTQVENILKRIEQSIYRIAQCPDFSSESFVGGVSSGVAIRYRLTGMETRASKIVAEMKKALQRRIEIICGIASLKIGEEAFTNIEIEFQRNIPTDTNSVVQLVNTLRGLVSDATLLGQIDFVADVNAELEAVKEQNSQMLSLYDFGANEE